jgi:hypothetical protein
MTIAQLPHVDNRLCGECNVTEIERWKVCVSKDVDFEKLEELKE